jgi:hypothetical protein
MTVNPLFYQLLLAAIAGVCCHHRSMAPLAQSLSVSGRGKRQLAWSKTK